MRRGLALDRFAVARGLLEGSEPARVAARTAVPPLPAGGREHGRCSDHPAEQKRARARLRVHGGRFYSGVCLSSNVVDSEMLIMVRVYVFLASTTPPR